jgi:predicted small lipoprotein YifL
MRTLLVRLIGRRIAPLLTLLLAALAVTVAGASLTACGQKGPLYLGPPKKSKVPQATPQPANPQPATPQPATPPPATPLPATPPPATAQPSAAAG